MSVQSEVEAFFEAFERNSSALDLDRIADEFAETFMSADPRQAIAVPKATFLAALPRRQAMFDAVGVTNVKLVEVDATELDARHVLAATTWEALRTEGEPVTLASTFILRRQENSFVVILYLNHQDLAEVLRPTR